MGGRGWKRGALPRTTEASNLGRGWNFTWDGQAGLGHPPWKGGGGGRPDGEV